MQLLQFVSPLEDDGNFVFGYNIWCFYEVHWFSRFESSDVLKICWFNYASSRDLYYILHTGFSSCSVEPNHKHSSAVDMRVFWRSLDLAGDIPNAQCFWIILCLRKQRFPFQESGPYNIFSSVWSKLFQYSSLLTNLKFAVVIIVAVLKLSSWQVWCTLSDTNMIIRCSLGAHHTVYHYHKSLIRYVDTTIDLDQEQILNTVFISIHGV